MSSSEGSAALHHPAVSGDCAGAAGETMLVSKVLTYSDVSTEVARTGRIVLPRIQVQQCLPELLRLCRAEQALPALRSGGPVKLSVDLMVIDEAGRTWVVLLKTWQNVVSGEHRPTFVLENTADFVRANRLAQGDTLAFCPRGGRMLLRTSLRADQLLPRQLKRAGGATAAAKRRSPPPKAATPTAAGEALAGRKRKAAAPAAAAWDGSPCNAEQAAQALLHMLCSSPESSQSEQLPLGHTSDHECSVGHHPAKRAAPARSPPGSVRASPAAAAAQQPHPVYRPTPMHYAGPAAGSPVHPAFQAQAALEQAAAVCAAAAAAQPQSELPSPLPLAAHSGATGYPPAEALAQAHAWLCAILAQQQRERQWVQQYNRMLLLQALVQEQPQALAPQPQQPLAQCRALLA